MTNTKWWRITSAVLASLFLLTVVLNLRHVRAGFLTNHLADLVVPAWMYMVARAPRVANQKKSFLQWSLGRSAEFAAISLFVASTLTEVSQIYWPNGFFSGRYDPLDIVSYLVGLIGVYLIDKGTGPPAAK